MGKQITLRNYEISALQAQYGAPEVAFKNKTKPKIKVKAVRNNEGDIEDNVGNFGSND